MAHTDPREAAPNFGSKSGLQPGICSGCGARIFWVRMKETDRRMPINPDPAWVVTLESDGQGSQWAIARDGYTSHFASCPNADSFRKKRGKARK